jgi:hypothetical protein
LRWAGTPIRHGLADKIENCLLLIGQLRHTVHLDSMRAFPSIKLEVELFPVDVTASHRHPFVALQ